LKRHEISSSRGGPFGVAVGKDGVVWATLQSGNQLLSILRDGKTAEFDVPTRGAAPTDVAVDVKGRPWFIEFRGNKVGVLENGKITEYEVPFENAGLSGLAAAPDGAMWFGLLRAHALGRVRNGKIDVLTLPRKEARPFSVAVDDKGNVWYADIGGFVGMIPSDQASRRY
jgi:virginiamycin B lyase